jgi:hypothetical protein
MKKSTHRWPSDAEEAIGQAEADKTHICQHDE